MYVYMCVCVYIYIHFLVAQLIKDPPAMWKTWVGKTLGVEHGNPLQYSCLENPHGQRSLTGYSPWGRKESDTTKPLKHI